MQPTMKTRRLGVAISGLGVGEAHARCARALPGVELTGLFDPNASKAASLATELSTSSVGSFDELLNDARTDVVIVASPDHIHAQQITDSLSRGKHVFCEKPLCNTRQELHAIASLWRRLGQKLKLNSNHVLRTAPLYLWLKQQIADGLLGEIYSFDGDYLYGRLWKITEGWRGFGENYSGMKGGGVHLIDLMCWLTGQRPSTVTTYGNNICSRNSQVLTTDYMSAMFRFSSGMVGRVTANLGCVHRHQHVLRIFGTQGTFLFDDAGPRMHFSRDPALHASRIELAPLPTDKSSLLAPFLEAIANGHDFSLTTQEVFDAVSICVACDRSLAIGQEMEIEYE